MTPFSLLSYWHAKVEATLGSNVEEQALSYARQSFYFSCAKARLGWKSGKPSAVKPDWEAKLGGKAGKPSWEAKQESKAGKRSREAKLGGKAGNTSWEAKQRSQLGKQKEPFFFSVTSTSADARVWRSLRDRWDGQHLWDSHDAW